MIKKVLVTLLVLPTLAQALPSALAVARSESVTTKIETPTTINSVHGVNLANDATVSKLFYWTVSLCPETQPNLCRTFSDHTALAPGQKWSHVYNFSTVVVFHAVGSKAITAKTEITGAAVSTAIDPQYVDVHY